MHAVQLLAGHAQRAVAVEAGGEHHQVEGAAQLVQRQVAADLQVAEELDAFAFEQPLELPADRLGALVIRRHAVAHQAEGRGQAVEQGDLRVRPLLAQGLGQVAAGGSAADDGDARRVHARGTASKAIGRRVAPVLPLSGSHSGSPS
ncbi:hypothetical protein D3C76_777950 [compost metagenome]